LNHGLALWERHITSDSLAQIFAIAICFGISVVLLRERKREKKRKKATNYGETQTPGMHAQHPGISGNKRGLQRIAQGSSVYIDRTM